jgi:C4-dicarboxylate-specific signal transduction histidine kinase
MQATQAAPPATPVPAPPAPPLPASAPSVTFIGTDGKAQLLPIPQTRQQIEDLKAQREELSNQLTSAASRRRNLAEQLNGMPPGPARTGVEQRIGVLDQRLAQLESDIASTGRQLSAAPLGTTEMPMPGDVPENVAIISTVFTVFVLFPMAVAMARRIWKRTTRESRPPAQLSPQVDQRLERLEQGVDAIAIEIERITEGQRFVTKLLSESGQPPLALPQERTAVSRE